MKKRKSRIWARRQQTDIYVRRAVAQGVRARSYYKLAQIDRKYRLLKPSIRVVDLGSAPGGWSQYVAGRVTASGHVIALDRLSMAPVPGVRFVQGDLCDPEICKEIIAWFGESRAHLVLSDMAPNITGVKSVDEANLDRMLSSVFGFAAQCLGKGGSLLIKVFEGPSAHQARSLMNTHFDQMVAIKPDASRSHSREFYLLGTGFLGLVSAAESGV